SQMHQQRRFAFHHDRILLRRQPQQQEFAIAHHFTNRAPRQFFFNFFGIIDEIRFPQRHAQDSPPRYFPLQAPRHRLDFWKFRHRPLNRSTYHTALSNRLSPPLRHP